ncbi:MAG: ATP synthase F1 subunit epsilon [Bacteroidales bacterium]|nr:ATP synthase F1 subunit epsilon [Bacteroidales bacterium]
MKLEIITPEKMLFEGNIHSLNVPGSKGPFMVLHNHAPIISTLMKGEIKIVSENLKTHILLIEGGVIEVKKNKIIVLADIA